MTGKHLDTGKPPLALVPRSLIESVAHILAYGERKYARDNWRGGIAWTRVANSVLRHFYAWLDGEDNDKESGLPHLAHAACNLAFLLEYAKTHPELDDRHKSLLHQFNRAAKQVGDATWASFRAHEFKPETGPLASPYLCATCGERKNFDLHVPHTPHCENHCLENDHRAECPCDCHEPLPPAKTVPLKTYYCDECSMAHIKGVPCPRTRR